ncbi:hypothetical protein [Desertivirga xinjiangensis]|uniref:hypothetical protein n=1 Tax=Desertivirga xinjiangensis TaxID=539206 RepID=UPI00210E570E|nr:hypothetical protein [Pedobacter xinjiangensis]
MKTLNLFILVSGLLIVNTAQSSAQSKKELVEMFAAKTDSLNNLLMAKNESLQKLEIKLAKLEGAAEANDKNFKRIEDRTDSLTKTLTLKDSIINSLKVELTSLTSSMDQLRETHKEATSKNEQLQAEIDTYRNKTVPASVTPIKKESKEVPATQKEVVKTESAETAVRQQ